ncbi:MAG: hypothetical protein RI953_2000 [Pseudomonadota bacterium]|jgi:hypothetical protein
MNETAPQATPTPVTQSLTKVHKVDAIPERTFWIGHISFSILAVVSLLIIILVRGPRRRDAMLSTSGSEGKD